MKLLFFFLPKCSGSPARNSNNGCCCSCQDAASEDTEPTELQFGCISNSSCKQLFLCPTSERLCRMNQTLCSSWWISAGDGAAPPAAACFNVSSQGFSFNFFLPLLHFKPAEFQSFSLRDLWWRWRGSHAADKNQDHVRSHLLAGKGRAEHLGAEPLQHCGLC